MPYKEGQRIEVRMPVEVRTGTFVNGTTRVSETGGNRGTVHYLSLSSDAALEEATGGLTRPVPGDRLNISLSARVGSGQGSLRTTRVTSAAGFDHYVFLDSSSVSAAARPAPGALVRAEFTARVLGRGGPSGTTQVEEVTGPGKGTVHSLFLSQASSRRQVLGEEFTSAAPAAGDTIRVSFTAAAQPLTVGLSSLPGDASRFTQVRTSYDESGSGWTHFLNVDSLSVNVVPAEEAGVVQRVRDLPAPPAVPVPARRAYRSGQRVRFGAEVEILTGNTGRLGTTRVREASGPGTGLIHYLYLGSPAARREVLESDARVQVGDKVRVTLSGRLLQDERTGAAAQDTQVTTRGDYTHYLNLASPSVTLATPEGSEAAVTTSAPGLTPEQAALIRTLTAPAGCKPGDEITFEADFEVIGNTGYLSGTTLGQEALPSGGTCRHYVYLNGIDSRTEVLGTGRSLPAPGETVKVRLRGKVRGPAGSGPEGTTTAVVSPLGYTHYLNLDSPSVRLATEPATAPPAIASFLEASAEDAGDASFIVGEGISSDGLAHLIREIPSGFQAVRARNDEVLFSAATREECVRYIDAEDFDPARVIVRAQVLDAANSRRLALLTSLQKAVSDALAGAGTWELKPEGFFTEDWAKDQVFTRDEFSALTPGDLDGWPLAFVDWEAAAEDERDALYTAVTFNGVTFYAETA